MTAYLLWWFAGGGVGFLSGLLVLRYRGALAWDALVRTMPRGGSVPLASVFVNATARSWIIAADGAICFVSMRANTTRNVSSQS